MGCVRGASIAVGPGPEAEVRTSVGHVQAKAAIQCNDLLHPPSNLECKELRQEKDWSCEIDGEGV